MYNQTSDSCSNTSEPRKSDTSSHKQPPNVKNKKNNKKLKKILSTTYKTKKCEFYNRGNCQKGKDCTFSHNFIPDHGKKKLCKYFLSGNCTKGQQCPYSHNTKRYPCKFFYILQNCHNDDENCRFSHDTLMDSEVELQFMRQNEDLIIKALKQGRKIEKVFIRYLEEKQRKEHFKNSQAQLTTKNCSRNYQSYSHKKIISPKKSKKQFLENVTQDHFQTALSSYLHSYY